MNGVLRFGYAFVFVGVIVSLVFAPVAAAAPPELGDRIAESPVVQVGVGNPSTLVAENFQVLGFSNLGGGSPHGDVFFYDHGAPVGKFAYVGTWSGVCSGTGVKIVDVNDPRNPKPVALAHRDNCVSTEDMVVARIGGRDILAVGVQACKAGRVGGLALYDVTNPERPRQLSFLRTPAGGVHELDLAVRPDGKAIAVLAVPFAEFFAIYFGAPLGGDFRVVDVTDPAAPVELTNWGIVRDSDVPLVAGIGPVTSPFQGIGGFAAYFAHSARTADRGMTAYVSYWDGGVLKFDLSDPAAPRLLARTTFPIDADGDAHSVAILDAGGDRYLFQNDEDFGFRGTVLATSSATKSAEFAGIQMFWSPVPLAAVSPLTGEVHDAGDGCGAEDYAGAAGKLALADTVDPFYVGIIPGWSAPCAIGDQAILAAQAGAVALVSNLVSPDDAYPFFDGDFRAVQREAADLVVVQLSDIDGLAAALRVRAGPDSLTLEAQPPRLGYVRVFRERTGDDRDRDGIREFREVGFFEHPADSGHNTEALGNRAYAAWYTQGIIALDVSDPAHPIQVGQFIPSTVLRGSGSLGPGPALVWGVAVDPATGTIYASDMRSGLWIIQPTGPAA